MTQRTKAILLLLLAVFIVYSNSLGGEFLSDDSYFIVKNIAVRNLSNIPSFFINPGAVAFSALAEDVYRPVTATSYAIDYFLYFLNSFGYHLENVIFHGLNVILLFLLLQLIVGDIFIAFFASLFFAMHPVQTEVVSWISGRSSVLFLFFYLWAFLLYVRAVTGRKRLFLIISIGLYAVSLFSKEMAVTLPAMLIVYDIHFPTSDRLRTRIARYLPYIALTALFIAIRWSALPRMSQCDLWGGTLSNNFLSVAAVFPEYLRLLVYPAQLCAFYVPQVVRSFAEPRAFIALGMLLAIALSLPFIYRRSRRVSFGICWFFVTILPVSNIVPLKALMADRFLYIPSIGFCLVLAIFLARLRDVKLKGMHVVAIVLASAIAIGYSVRTMVRNEDWKDSVTLCKSIIAVSPLNSWGYTSLGTSYIAKGEFDKAIKPLKKAMSLARDYAAPRAALGFCYLKTGNLEGAVAMFNESLKHEPKNLEALGSLGVAYAQLGRYDEAIKTLKRAIEIDPTYVSAYLNLGTAYEHTDQFDKAFEIYTAIPSHTNSLQDIGIAQIRLGDLSLRLGDPDTARKYYRQCIDICGGKFLELKMVAEERMDKMMEIEVGE